MKLQPFALERYFAEYEFSAKYLLSSSDCDGLLQSDLIEMADDQMLKMWQELRLGYTESLGHPLLRQEISQLYHGVDPENCLVVVPEEGIFIALNSMLVEGDHVICTFPGYQSLYEIAQGLGCAVTKWQPEEENGWRFNPDFLEQNIQPNTKLIIVNFPHNPTGYLPPVVEFERIVEIARKNNIYLLSDEMYRYLELDPGHRLPSACELYERAVSLSGMSKTFGMAGVRLGWVVTKDRSLYKKMATFKDYTTICSSAPSEVLSIIALRAKDKIIDQKIAIIKKNLKLLDDFFARYKDKFEWVKPRAGTICFPKLKSLSSSADFCQKIVQQANIMLLPSKVYDYGDKHFRIGFGRENMPLVISVWEEYFNTSFSNSTK